MNNLNQTVNAVTVKTDTAEALEQVINTLVVVKGSLDKMARKAEARVEAASVALTCLQQDKVFAGISADDNNATAADGVDTAVVPIEVAAQNKRLAMVKAAVDDILNLQALNEQVSELLGDRDIIAGLQQTTEAIIECCYRE